MRRLFLAGCLSALVTLFSVSPAAACLNDSETVKTEREFKKHYEFRSGYSEEEGPAEGAPVEERRLDRVELRADVHLRRTGWSVGPGELLAVLLAREPVTEGDVGSGVAIGVHQGFVQGVVPELVGVRRRQRVDVQDEDRP